jgi:hypothetical protein
MLAFPAGLIFHAPENNRRREMLSTEPETARAGQECAGALKSNRARLAALIDRSVGAARRNSVGLLLRNLRPLAENHPYCRLAAGAGGVAGVAPPRVATGLIVPILWSGGRQFVQGTLPGGLSRRRSGPAAQLDTGI